MVRVLLVALVLLVGCDLVDRVVDAGGVVYDCGDLELCYFADSAAELGDLTGRGCSEATVGDRWWPGLTNLLGRGCRYVCPGQIGCNAKQGCFCPEGERQ